MYLSTVLILAVTAVYTIGGKIFMALTNYADETKPVMRCFICRERFVFQVVWQL